ncbi:Imm21 family immunity protein [Streptomyces sp. NPDC004539]|uniref:Imm21 family immunity protein n=1 Tax=Streptomyces sp. NPDC004539 TaxID=3154280 RepID=UPI0033A9414D
MDSEGGPLVVVPVSARWRALPVWSPGGALVLAGDPASTRYLPEHRAFLRWSAADSETGLRAAAETVLAPSHSPGRRYR